MAFIDKTIIPMIDNALSNSYPPSISFKVKDKSDYKVRLLKEIIKIHNDNQTFLYKKYGIDPKYVRVSIMGRGPRRNHKIKIMGPYGKYRSPKWHPNADCNLQHKYAKWFEIYAHRDGTREYKLRERRGY